MNTDGSQRSRFTKVEDTGWIIPCGQYFAFLAYKGDTTTLMRVDQSGTNPVKLVSGNLWSPACSRDGEFVFYVATEQPQKIWKVPANGGLPVFVAPVLGDLFMGRLSVSPDGKLLAYSYTQYGEVPSTGWKTAVVAVEGGLPVKQLDSQTRHDDLRWSPDGTKLEYFLDRNGASNIWEQPLNGGKPKQLTRFTSGQIFDFNWSPDGARLLLTRGNTSSDVVLLTDLHRP
jgi:Tol biopolymer transport system component